MHLLSSLRLSFFLDPAQYSLPTFDHPSCPFSMFVFLNTSHPTLCSGLVSLDVGMMFKV